jgi:capsular exopolysaccharide synthesis family protein
MEISDDRGTAVALAGASNANLPSTEFREAVPSWEGEEVHLRDYLEVLVRRKWLILAVLALCFLSTMVFTLTATKIYQATASLEVTRDAPKVTKFQEMVNDQVNAREFYETQANLIKSKALTQRVVDRLNLAEHPVIVKALFDEKSGEAGMLKRMREMFHSLLAPKGAPSSLAVPQETIDQQELLKFLDENLSATLRRNATLISIAFTSPDRKLSQDVVNTLVDEFLRWKMDQRLEASQLAREFLNKQIDRAKINLEKAEETLNQFAKQSGIVSLDSKLNSVYSQLEELNTALAKAEADFIGKQAVYNQAVTDGAASLPQVLSNTLIANLKGEHSKLKSEYDLLTTTFREEYPEVKKLKAQMLSLEQRITLEEHKVFKAIKNEHDTALAQLNHFKVRTDQQKDLALKLNEQATQYKIMEREVETNKGIYQSLLERTKEIEAMVGVTSSNINIVDRPALPILPHKPNVPLNLMLAIALGVIGGIGCAFLVEYFADAITNPDQITERFQIPILGVVPLARAASYPLDMAFVSDPRAPLSESVRTAKVSIQLSGTENHGRSILITSTSPGEGKTTIALNLAMAFAGGDEKVLLIDADLRKPRVHKAFGAFSNGSGPGLSSLLAGVVKTDVCRESGIENLWFIPAGPIPPNPVELLASNRFNELMAGFLQRYDRVLLDGPPHHGFADILVLSRKVGGIVLVSSIGETTRNGLRHFKKGIANVRGTILGCIINKVNTSKRFGYGAYYRYYQYYNTDYGQENKRHKRIAAKHATLRQ